MNQEPLPLFRPIPANPDVAAFVDMLRDYGRWMTAKEAIYRMGLSDTESYRRIVRAWAEAAEGEVISGQLGYRHVSSATAEEIGHAADWLESQARKMTERAIRIPPLAHQLVG